MPAAMLPCHQQEIDRRQGAVITRLHPTFGAEYLPIVAALGIRLQVKVGDQGLDSGMHGESVVSNEKLSPRFA